MNISIITPVYNEEKNIDSYFKAINRMDYPKKYLEIIIVNDGSKDNSLNIIRKNAKKSKFKIEIINLKKNRGRAKAREIGAKKAKFNNLLFLDCKCEIFPDALKKIVNSSHKIIIGHIQQKNKNVFDRFLYLIRAKLFKKDTEIYITKKNFDKIKKGTGLFFCNKATFLKCLPEKKDKNISDDTKLLFNIIKKTKILKSKNIRAYYNTRKSLIENIKHIFLRGPKFVDYYYRPNKKKFFLLINISLILLAIIILLIITQKFINIFLLALILSNLIFSIYFSKKAKDFFILFVLTPIFGSFFFLGIIFAIIQKLIKNKKILGTLLAILFLIFFALYLYQNREIIKEIQKINIIYIITIAVFLLFTLYINGLFLKILSSPFKIKLKEHFLLSLSASLLNLITPFRGGAGVRAVYMKKKYNMRYSHFISTLFGNYIIVFLTNSSTALIIFSILYFTNKIFNIYIFLIFLTILIICLFLIIKPISFKKINFITSKINKVLEGWKIIAKNKKIIPVLILLSITNILFFSLINKLAFLGINIHLSLTKSIFFSVITTLSIFINITPGSLGITESLYLISSQIIQISPPIALIAALIIRAVNTITLLIFGTIANLLLIKKQK